MDHTELVKESISYFENAKKRNLDLLKSVNRFNVRLQLERENEPLHN
jgi:hypothetical protein